MTDPQVHRLGTACWANLASLRFWTRLAIGGCVVAFAAYLIWDPLVWPAFAATVLLGFWVQLTQVVYRCPFCFSRVAPGAAVCPKCSSQVTTP